MTQEKKYRDIKFIRKKFIQRLKKIRPDEKAASKAELIDYMTRLMEKTGNLNDREMYKEGVFSREKEGTTGIGEGIAIPHAKSAAVKKAGLAAVVIKEGVDYDSLDGEPVDLALTMRAKQPKRGVVAGEKGFIEICEYPRAQKATVTYTEDGRTEVIEEGRTEEALQYEVRDMQDYVLNHGGQENLQIIRDVMHVLTAVRDQWGMTYPFE